MLLNLAVAGRYDLYAAEYLLYDSPGTYTVSSLLISENGLYEELPMFAGSGFMNVISVTFVHPLNVIYPCVLNPSPNTMLVILLILRNVSDDKLEI